MNAQRTDPSNPSPAAQRAGDADRVRVAIIGATGYGGAELLRLLVHHPGVVLTRLAAKDHVGQRIDAVHTNLYGLCDLVVEDADPDAVAPDADLVFLGLPHRTSAVIGDRYAKLGCRVIDLSGDWRLDDPAVYAQFYGCAHPFPDRLGTWAYGLPELDRTGLRGARFVASPGCFATAITLALLPFARAGLLPDRVAVCAMTGSSGSGANPSAGTHHPVRSVTLRAYKALDHQHTPEIELNLRRAGAGAAFHLDFVPVSAPLSRGILTSCFFEVPAAVDAGVVDAALDAAFANEPLVRVVRGRLPEVAAVKGSMFVDVAATVGPLRGDRRTIVAHSALDNLVKGGAGQAVQAMNVALGFDETLGLLAPALWP
jgi:LysW-gamma-L-alpha-aminoadipyl-6-phosphate/LysW-L-glutamyl-5-phosphate reductase